jgi:signal transduction histidine kinase
MPSQSPGNGRDACRRERRLESGIRERYLPSQSAHAATVEDARTLIETAVTPREVFPSIVRVLRRIAPVCAAAFVHCDPRIRPIRWCERSEHRAAAEAEAVAVTTLRYFEGMPREEYPAARPRTTDTGWRWLTLPSLDSRSRIVGARALAVTTTASAFDEDVLSVVATVARLLADLAVRPLSRDDPAPKARPMELDSIVPELTTMLFTTLDYRASLARVASALVRGASSACVIRIDGGRALSIVEGKAPSDRVAARALVPLIEAVATSGTPLLPGAPMTDLAARSFPGRAVVCVPIRGAKRHLGALAIACDPATGLSARGAGELAHRIGAAVENGRLYESAVEGIRARDEILSTVSHDLKNPLGVILASASRMLHRTDGAGRAGDDGPLRAIERSANRMRRLVGDLLDIAAIESGALTLEPTPCSANVLVREAVSAASAAAEQADVALIDELPDLPPVSADGERCLQVLGNLLDNAIRFTLRGGRITVRAQVREHEVALAVTDTGVGIDAGELPHVFDRFWQADHAHRIGTGLGLAICKSIVERSGGTISARSAVGVGTTIEFTLPRARTGA